LLGFWALLDDWQQQIIIPLCCESAFNRRMRVRALKTGDKRFLQVKADWAVPTRGHADPVKDLMGEILAIRAGLQTLTRSLARRGIDIDKHLDEIKRINDLLDLLKIAIDTDPRKVTSAGILQAAAPYLFKAPADGAASDTEN
jgi:capsid protein